jgi:hypothetical protein
MGILFGFRLNYRVLRYDRPLVFVNDCNSHVVGWRYSGYHVLSFWYYTST